MSNAENNTYVAYHMFTKASIYIANLPNICSARNIAKLSTRNIILLQDINYISENIQSLHQIYSGPRDYVPEKMYSHYNKI